MSHCHLKRFFASYLGQVYTFYSRRVVGVCMFSINNSKLGLGILGAVFLVILVIFSCSIAHAQSSDNTPVLTEGQVTPENGVWGDNFTFKVTYTENENNLPAIGYPKVYIDNHPENMAEDDPADNDVTDSKLYKYAWTTSKEGLGSHNFYFYVEDNQGDNDRDPEDGSYKGPSIGKRSTSLTCELDNPNPDPGENVTFKGYLKTVEDDQGVPGENIVLYKLLTGNDVTKIRSVNTNENGRFSLSIEAPSPGISVYRIKFLGDNYHRASKSSRFHVNTLDESLVWGVSVAVILIIPIVLIFLFSRGLVREHYFKPVIMGFAVGLFLNIIPAGFLGLLLAGGVAGYFFAKRTGGWTKHLRVGLMTGFLLLLVLGSISVFPSLGFPELFSYSVSQSIIFSQIVLSLVSCVLWTGLGAVVGGMLGGTPKSSGD